jgi:hypothetical protein
MAGDARLPHQLPENASDASLSWREMLARVQVQRGGEERQGWRGRVRGGPATACGRPAGRRRQRWREREIMGKGVELGFESPPGCPHGSDTKG